jgi:hypothetical protein
MVRNIMGSDAANFWHAESVQPQRPVDSQLQTWLKAYSTFVYTMGKKAAGTDKINRYVVYYLSVGFLTHKTEGFSNLFRSSAAYTKTYRMGHESGTEFVLLAYRKYRCFGRKPVDCISSNSNLVPHLLTHQIFSPESHRKSRRVSKYLEVGLRLAPVRVL